ncbi:hypothetical protein MNEG_13477 [Monoraphidium neglectum]|uniref:Uncharacterized protein n=1 Tax=Monoraphidium neglectum TaxID=145388 RepID=A0A0D2LYF7_9CHLO|nr:hypothetical protein MNEG_13477 [Monoraphidium neglectum]KIY94486.1 hypothetical protein MNEG_13477 [Monoraphidium neglectum]|eukprot:XP_013893506.1 hypothetical protein MNEG_13477 [Monoraphidium neglectum]
MSSPEPQPAVGSGDCGPGDRSPPCVQGVRLDLTALGLRHLPGLPDASELMRLELPPRGKLLDWFEFLSRPGCASACGFGQLGPDAVLLAPLMHGSGGGGGEGVFIRTAGGDHGNQVVVSAAVFAPSTARTAIDLCTIESEAQALELLALPPPTKRVTMSGLVPGGRAPRAEIEFGPDGEFQAVVLGTGSLVPAVDVDESKARRRKRQRMQQQQQQQHQQAHGAQDGGTWRAVLLQQAFLVLHCLVAMAAFCWEPSTRDLEQPSAARGPEPEPDWLASAWVLALAGGAVRVPMPETVGQALLELLDRDSSANTSLRTALASASARSREGQQG